MVKKMLRIYLFILDEKSIYYNSKMIINEPFRNFDKARVAILRSDENLCVEYRQKICRRCILPESFPDILFNKEGICSYCNANDVATMPDQAKVNLRLKSILDIASPDRKYDCISLFSGGKDSSFSLIQLKENYGLKVLAFTFDNNFQAKGAFENIEIITKAIDVDHMFYRPDKKATTDLLKISVREKFNADTIKYSPTACGSCISALLAGALDIAKKYNIPLLSGGWTPGQFTNDAFVEKEFLISVCRRHLGYIKGRSELVDNSFLYDQLENYKSDVWLFNPLYCSRYDEDFILKALAVRGWTRPTDTDSCSTNCRLNGFLVVHHILKYGFHPYVYETAQHVRLGYLDRNEGLQKMTSINMSPEAVQRLASELDLELEIKDIMSF